MIFYKTIIKLVAYLAAVVIFGLSLAVVLQSDHLRLITQFETLKEIDPRVRATELAEKGDYCQAIDYMEYFMDYDYVKRNPAIAEYYKQLRKNGSLWHSGVRMCGMAYGRGKAHARSQ